MTVAVEDAVTCCILRLNLSVFRVIVRTVAVTSAEGTIAEIALVILDASSVFSASLSGVPSGGTFAKVNC